MSVPVSCPGCQAVYPVPENLIGKTIRCKACGEMMPVVAPEPVAADVIEDDEPPRTKPSRRRTADEEEDAPKAKSPRRRERDEDDEPKPLPKRRPVVAADDDEDDDVNDDRPSRGKKAAPKSKLPLIVGGSVAALVLVGGIVAAMMLTGGDKPDDKQPLAAANPNPTTAVTPSPNPTPAPKPETTPTPKPEPEKAVEPKLDPKPETKLEDIKPSPRADDLKISPSTPTTPKVEPGVQVTGRGSSGRGSSTNTASTMSAEAYFNGSISDLTMDLSTRASVFIKCATPAGEATGSGWFGLEPGLVFTNAHVINMLAPNSPEPSKLTFYLNSGTRQQREIPHAKIKILAVDRDIDLAVLQIIGEPDLPSPMKVKPSADLKLGQSVYTLGFPLGARLNMSAGSKAEPSISVRKTSFIGHVANDYGQVRRVKVEGGLSPGNSGGAVVDAEGVVVGVNVQITNGGTVGNYIGLLVPTEYVLGIMAGRVSTVDYGIAYNDNGKVRVPVTANILNPMKRSLTVRVRSWIGDVNAKYRPPGLEKPSADPNDGGAQDVELTYDPTTKVATGELVFPAPPAGRTFWAQPYYTNSLTTYSMPGAKISMSGPPVDRVPVNLTAAPKEGAKRTVTMSNSSALSEDFEGEGEAKNDKVLVKKSLTVREQVVKADKTDTRQLARLQLSFESFSIAQEYNGLTVMEISKKEQEQFLHYFKAAQAFGLVNKFGEVYNYTLSVAGVSDPLANFVVNLIANGALEALEATSIPMPNKVLQPKDTWEATKDVRFTMFSRPQAGGLSTPGSKDLKPKSREFKYQDKITYTYLGVRERAGRKEAVISVTGKSVPAPGTKQAVTGGVKGIIWVEPETGVVVLAEIEREFDLDTSRDGQKRQLSGMNTYKLDRGPAQ